MFVRLFSNEVVVFDAIDISLDDTNTSMCFEGLIIFVEAINCLID